MTNIGFHEIKVFFYNFSSIERYNFLLNPEKNNFPNKIWFEILIKILSCILAQGTNLKKTRYYFIFFNSISF